MHPEWVKSFDQFYDYVLSLPFDGRTIDRIDSAGNYSPGNLRWATPLEQANNTKANRKITLDGLTLNVAEWERRTGIDRSLITARIDRLGWTIERAIKTPVGWRASGNAQVEAYAATELGLDIV